MSTTDLFSGAMPSPLAESGGEGDYSQIPAHLNAAFTAVPHGLPDSSADHPLPAGGPTPDSAVAQGAAPSLYLPVG